MFQHRCASLCASGNDTAANFACGVAQGGRAARRPGDSGRPMRPHGIGGHHAAASRCMTRGSAMHLENGTATTLFNASE